MIKNEAKMMIQRVVFLLLENCIKWFLWHKYNEIIKVRLYFFEAVSFSEFYTIKKNL